MARGVGGRLAEQQPKAAARAEQPDERDEVAVDVRARRLARGEAALDGHDVQAEDEREQEEGPAELCLALPAEEHQREQPEQARAHRDVRREEEVRVGHELVRAVAGHPRGEVGLELEAVALRRRRLRLAQGRVVRHVGHRGGGLAVRPVVRQLGQIPADEEGADHAAKVAEVELRPDQKRPRGADQLEDVGHLLLLDLLGLLHAARVQLEGHLPSQRSEGASVPGPQVGTCTCRRAGMRGAGDAP